MNKPTIDVIQQHAAIRHGPAKNLPGALAWLPICVGLLTLPVFPGNSAQAQTPADLPLATAAVVREVTLLEREYDGTVEAVNQGTMSAQTNARVAELFYDVNDYVEQGAPIVRFTDVEQRAVLQQAKASLKEALARQREAEAELLRTSNLYETGSATKREYDRARAARDAAVARARSAQSTIDSAGQGVEYTLVRAPFSGIVTERHVEVGESVTVGQALTSGLSLEKLRVLVDLPQNMMPRVRENLSGAIVTDNGRVLSEQVTIFPYADAATNTFRVRLDLPAGQFGLYPGMFVKVAFVVGEAERLLIPLDALLRRSEVIAVYVVKDVAQVRLRQIRIGNTYADRVEVLAGLQEGERVALDPVRAGIAVNSASAREHAR